jgi:hypothetical protein
MLKSKDQDLSALNLNEFTNYNRKLFFDPSLPQEQYTPVNSASIQYITPAELKNTLQHAFKANKSAGISNMPLQILRHMGDKGIACVAGFLNKSAID